MQTQSVPRTTMQRQTPCTTCDADHGFAHLYAEYGSRCWQGVLSAPIWPERCRPGGGRSFSPPSGRKRPAKGRALFQPSVCQLARARPAKGEGALSALRLARPRGSQGAFFQPPSGLSAASHGEGSLTAPFRHGNGDDTNNSGQGGFLISNDGEDKYTKATVAR